MSAAHAFSSATIDHVTGPDGERLVRKRFSPAGDWLTRATDGLGRTRVLWDCGFLDRGSAVLDHTVIDMTTEDGHDVAVMRDVSAELIPTQGRISRTVTRRLLGGLARLHTLSVDTSWPSLCTIGARYQMFAPQRVAADSGPHPHPSSAWIVDGWTSFDRAAPAPVADAVRAVHEDPSVVADALAGLPSVMLHGDAKPANLGVGRRGVVAIDWGELTGCGPREIDVSWFVLMFAHRAAASPDELFADYEAIAGVALDHDALDLTAIGSLAQMGWRILLPEYADVTQWWIGRVGEALSGSVVA